MAIRMQLTPDDFKRAKIVKPGWTVLLLKEFNEELNSKKDAMNVVCDTEVGDPESEFFGVPIKHWFSEKAVSMPGGAVQFFKAFNPKWDENQMAEAQFDDKAGLYIYAKVKTDRGVDGQQPPRNVIEDWAPLPAKYRSLNEKREVAAGVGGFDKS